MTYLNSESAVAASGLASEHENFGAEELIAWTLDAFGKRAAICTSFLAEGMIILDLAVRMDGEAHPAGCWWWETIMPKECGIHVNLAPEVTT